MPTFQKLKQNRMKEMRKRFHFDRQAQANSYKPQQATTKQRVSDIIIRDQNGQYSSVKDKNDFNDSSWLSKLVNGIEQSYQPNKLLCEVQNVHSTPSENLARLGFESQMFSITRKSSQQSQKTNAGRKSAPLIQSLKYHNSVKHKQNLKTNHNSSEKDNRKSQNIGQKQKYEKRTSYQASSSNDQKKFTKNNMYNARTNQQYIKICLKQQAHKNSLINYSSIQQEDKNFQTQKQQQTQKIVIDLDQISLKTQISCQATPAQTKQQKNKEQKDRQTSNNKKIQSKLQPKLQKNQQIIKKNMKDITNHKKTNSKQTIYKGEQTSKSKKNVQKKLHSTPQQNKIQTQTLAKQIQQKPVKEQNKKPTNDKVVNKVVQQPIIQNKNNLNSSQNQFLDTFKQFQLVQPAPSTRVGMIKKNKVKKPNENSFVSKLEIKNLIGQFNQQTKIPTFNERPVQQNVTIKILNQKQETKKNYHVFSPIKQSKNIKKQNVEEKSISTIKKGQFPYSKTLSYKFNKSNPNITAQCVKQSPKFNYPIYSNKIYAQLSQPNRHTKQLNQYTKFSTKAINYQQIFKKLDKKNQMKIYKQNCNDLKLNQEQKYQIGSILSKIKYLDKTYCERQFVNQCLKLQNVEESIKNNQHWQNDKINNYHTFQLLQNNSSRKGSITPEDFKFIRKRQDRNIIRDGQNVNRGNIMNNNSNDKLKNYEKVDSYLSSHDITERHDLNVTPLFPETIKTKIQNLGPRRSPYLEMPSLTNAQIHPNNEQQLIPRKSQGDIGLIIDNLNSKLSNYIQTNNLQDTYRKFKLDFVQLRRNMQY